MARQLQQLGLALHEDDLEPTLDEVSHQSIAAIGHVGVDAVEPTLFLGEVGLRGLGDEAAMAGDLAMGVATPVLTAACHA